MTEPLFISSRTDWTPELIERTYREIEKIAAEELELGPDELYPNQFEIVSSEQMIDAYTSGGLPVHFNHWSFGKDFLKTQRAYQKGRQGLALELVINSSPCQSFLMEDNDMVMMAMVVSHAAIGHNAVFKNNECFKEWTNAGSIIDYMIFARDYIRQCEERYGDEEVEMVLDAAHALAPHGVDKFKRKHHPKLTEEARLQKLLADEENRQHELDIIMKRTSFKDVDLSEHDEDDFIEEEENLLYFIMKYAPGLVQWKREVIRIIYKIHTYFYPQHLCGHVHEGYACFCHYYIMTRLEEKGILSADAFMSFLSHHAAVIHQPEYNKRYYSGINKYALGFAIFQDIKRICEHPTAEDREYFPQLIGRRWQDAVKEAAFEHRDDGFVSQYLSPKVIRDFRMFSITVKFMEDEEDEEIPAIVSEIHDDVGYKNIRNSLARSLERINHVPQIKVVSADLEGSRTLCLEYVPYMGRTLQREDADSVVEYIDYLWSCAIELEIPD